MKLKDVFFLIKRKFFQKRNIILMFIIILLTFTLLLSLTIYNYFNNYDHDLIKRNLVYRFIDVQKEGATTEEYDKLSNIEHVIYNKPNYMKTTIYLDILDFANNENAQLRFKPLYDINEPTIVKGHNISKDNEVICSSHFYPYEVDDKIAFNKKLFIKDKDLIETTFKINYDNVNANLKIVGTFDSYLISESMNTCYISEKMYESLMTNNNVYGRVLKVDKYENVQEVIQKINDLGFKISSSKLSTNMQTYKHIPVFVSILTILVMFIILYNFLKKKLRYNLSNYGILKACGYTDNNVYLIEIIENIIIITFCYIITILIFLIFYYYIINIPYIRVSYFEQQSNFVLPINSFILAYIITILINVLCIKILMKFYIKNKSIYEILEEKL